MICSCTGEHFTNKNHCNELFLFFHNSHLLQLWLTSESSRACSKNTNVRDPTPAMPNQKCNDEVQESEFYLALSSLLRRG